MPTDVIMPQMGESIFEGTITKWLKQPGERVERDQPLFEISTDKVDAEIPAPAGGILKEIKAQAGATVQVNSVVAVIDDSGAAASVVPPPAAHERRPHRLRRKPPPRNPLKRLRHRPARPLRLSCRRWENPSLKAPSRAG